MLRVGLEAPNESRLLTPSEIERIKALGSRVVKIRAYHPTGVVDQILAICPDCLFLLRRGDDGRIDPAGQVSEARRLVEYIKSKGQRCIYILDNEPDHQDSPYKAGGALRYVDDLQALILAADDLDVPLCSPPMAVEPNDWVWLQTLEPMLQLAGVEYRACHLYWQMDNERALDWGRRLAGLSQLCPGAHWIVDEVGDSSESAEPWQRAGRIADVLCWLKQRGDVEAATLFIAGSNGDPRWERFILPASELTRIRTGLEATTVPEIQYAVIGNGYKVVDLRGKLPASGDYPQRPLSSVAYLVIHHSAVDSDSTAESIARYHVENEGWPGIGYHFIVHQDGRTEYCQDISRASYHVAKRNHECIGICLPGNWTDRQPTVAQLDATRRLLGEIQYQLGWFVPIVGHQDVALSGYRTACPGDTWPQWRECVTVRQPAPSVPEIPSPRYVLGFADLAYNLGSAVVGKPLEDEHQATVQETERGIMVWWMGQPARFFPRS